MIELEKNYKKELEVILGSIKDSEHLSAYLDTEDENHYAELKSLFEPLLEELHERVAINDPLQLIALELAMLDSGFEGLFLPRILGYSVLRGAVDDQFKYIRPQNHFRDVLLAIASSANFELLSQRIGQTIEVGFALSSDIWITNLVSEISNKQVKSFLQEQRKQEYRDPRSRHTAYAKYQKQLSKYNFLTVDTPLNGSELKIEYRTIRNFLLHRTLLSDTTSTSVYSFLSDLVKNGELAYSIEHLEILLIIAMFFDLQDKEAKALATHIGVYADKEDDMHAAAFIKLQHNETRSIKDADYLRIKVALKEADATNLKRLLGVIESVINIGYINADALELVKDYCNSNQGLSLENEAIRNFIFVKFEEYMATLQEGDYNEYFELNKTFVGYMILFDNEKFNQGIKDLSMRYVKRLLKKYIDKRGREYQDIKRFVSASFLDQGFLKDKEIKELFKTKRKKI